jgi:replicative DNA helicase
MIGEGYQWNEDFQMRLLAYLMKDPEKMFDIVEPQFFSGNPMLVEIARILKENYAAHGKEIQIPRTTLTELVRATMGEQDSWSLYRKTIKKLYKIKLTDKSILYKQAFEFAKESRYRDALIAAEKDVTNRRYQKAHDRIEDLRNFGKDSDLGLEYWKGLDKKGIKTRWIDDRFGVVPTGFPTLDRRMEGGLAEGELGIILAGGKVGKTTALANFAVGAMRKMKTVAIASGELSAKKYRRRIDAMMSRVTSKDLFKNRRKVLKELTEAHRITKGSCFIRQFPTGKASTGDIEAWLDNLENEDIHVDILLVDYLALFRPVNKSTERRLSIGQTGIELRGIAVERNIPVWTASQGNRASLSKSVLTPQDFAEDISQFWTLDFMLALCQDKKEEKDHHCRIILAAARDVGAGAIIKCQIERKIYRITEKHYDDKNGSSSSKEDVGAESNEDGTHLQKPKVSNDD